VTGDRLSDVDNDPFTNPLPGGNLSILWLNLRPQNLDLIPKIHPQKISSGYKNSNQPIAVSNNPLISLSTKCPNIHTDAKAERNENALDTCAPALADRATPALAIAQALPADLQRASET
jgi:hypothetical protein